jgi:hypothetical protein
MEAPDKKATSPFAWSSPRESDEGVEVSRDESLLLLTRPPLDLTLSYHSRSDVRSLLRMDKNDRTPSSCVRSALPRLVIGDTSGEVSGGADVERAVATEKHVDPSHQTTMPKSSMQGQPARVGKCSLRAFASASGQRRGFMSDAAPPVERDAACHERGRVERRGRNDEESALRLACWQVLAQGIRLGQWPETRLHERRRAASGQRRGFMSDAAPPVERDAACHERGRAERRGRVEWCGRKDSNLHPVARTSS